MLTVTMIIIVIDTLFPGSEFSGVAFLVVPRGEIQPFKLPRLVSDSPRLVCFRHSRVRLCSPRGTFPMLPSRYVLSPPRWVTFVLLKVRYQYNSRFLLARSVAAFFQWLECRCLDVRYVPLGVSNVRFETKKCTAWP